MANSFLSHPLTRGLHIDDPSTTLLRKTIVQQKPFLKAIYEEWYAQLIQSFPDGGEPILKLGSGAGFLSDYLPGLIASEVFSCPGISLVADARNLPFRSRSLRAIAMTDVLHHIPDSRAFFREASRCLRPGGVVTMIEPWLSSWSRLVFKHLHHEPCEPQSKEWGFLAEGPLSGANEAIPWIVFHRDRSRFESEFPELTIETVKPMMPFRYIVSGGVSMHNLMPSITTPLWKAFEASLSPWMDHLAMFALITLRRTSA